jgi:RHS repeat-associated protein
MLFNLLRSFLVTTSGVVECPSSTQMFTGIRCSQPSFVAALLCLALLITVGSVGAAAQTAPNLENGFKRYGSYDGSNLDTVNTMNGNLMLHASLLPDYPQRGKIAPHYNLYVSSKNWQVKCRPDSSTPGGNVCWWQGGGTGVTLQTSVGITVHRTLDKFGSGTGTVTYEAFGYSLTGPDGAIHQFYGIPASADANGEATKFEAEDTSGFHMELSNPDSTGVLTTFTVTDRNGNQYVGNFSQIHCSRPASNKIPAPGSIKPAIDDAPLGDQFCSEFGFGRQVTDSNGNWMTLNGPDSTGGTPNPGIDTLGKSAPLSSGSATTDFSKCSSSLPINSAFLLNYNAPDGSTQVLEVCYANIPIQTAFSQPGVAQAPNSVGGVPGQQLGIVSVVLADGSQWTFSYDSYGELTTVGLPTGGSISYTWTEIGMRNCTAADRTAVSRAVATRTINDNNGNSFTWHYSWGAAQSDGTLTNLTNDSLGNDTVHVFTAQDGTSGCGFYETRTQHYQGLRSSGQLLQQVATGYASAILPVDSLSGSGLSNVVPTSIKTTIYPSGKVSLITKSYDTGLGANAPNFGNVVSEKVYDWGQGAPGALLREADTSYVWQSDARYLSAHLLDLPASQVIKDGNGNRVAETDYIYDESQYLTASNITTQHGAAPNAVRGNLTTVSRWLNTSNSFISSHTNWYDSGQVFQAIDPLGNTTTHSYDPAYAGAYSTQTCNALNQCVSGSYDFNTGVLTSFTDANASSQASGTTPGDSAHTSTYVYDFMSRLASATLPTDAAGNHPQTTFNYPNPTTGERLKKITASLTDDAFTFADGLGRGIRSQHVTPSGNAYVDTTYDGLDRVATVTNPYLSTSDPTYGVTQYQYDGLGRGTQTTKQDGSVSTVSYVSNCTTSTDEAGKQRRGCIDGLGRLIEVDEPSVSSGGMAASGSLAINGTLQTKPATAAQPGTGTVTFKGTEQNKSGVGATSGASGTGSVTISGSEGVVTSCNPDIEPTVQNPCPGAITFYDSGLVTIIANGHSTATAYGSGSNANSVASGLAAAINNDGGAFVNATASTNVLYLTARQAGSASNYAWSVSSASNDTSGNFGPGGSFGASASPGSLAGGQNAAAGTTVYDSGTCSVTVNGTPYSTNFGQGDSTITIASRLAGIITSGSLVSAVASGSTVSLTAKTTGAASNYPFSAACSFNSSTFSSASFNISNSGATLAGGVNGISPATDSGTVTVSVGSGFSVSACYGKSGTCQIVAGCPTGDSTAAQVACVLGQGLSAGNSPVSPTVSGSSISLVYRTPGQAGNVALTVTSTPTQPNIFPGGSFTGGTTLSGGVDPQPAGLKSPYVTLYAYDALGNLLSVNQKGDGSQPARNRSFTYDSLSRLLSAQNPESGTISYAYDDTGNLLQKTSPAPNQTGAATQTVSYCYDALNRVTGWAYAAQSCQNGQLPLGTAAVSYAYDAGANGIGRLSSVTDQAGSVSYNYDVLGRILSEQRTIGGVKKGLSYTYNLDGSLASMTYPSGAVITYKPDAAGRTFAAVDTGNSINYASGATYGPDNGLTSFVSGQSNSFSGITNSYSYNKRLQPVNMSASSPSQTVFSIGYDFHSGNGDNGNVWGITNYKDTTRSQSFTYDALNRLSSAQNSGTDCTATVLGGKTKFWGNIYSYDAWGNLRLKTPTKCSAENLNVAVGANNQLQGGYIYDAAGNMTHDASTNLNYSYDQENRLTGVAGFSYTYDHAGNRVKKTNGTTGTLYWYMSPGIVAESDLAGNLQSEYVFFDGQRVARKDLPNGSVAYYFSDHLKTASVITDATGNIKSESDYYPWGGELQFLSNDSNHYKFTGKERDAESGMDYFGARYYSNSLGRFVTTDPLMASARVSDPQTWNRYSYARNNPERFLDPTGMKEVTADQCKKDQECVSLKLNVIYDKSANDGKGLTDKQKDRFDKQQLQHAKDQYGSANIHLDVIYSEGSLSNGVLTGLVSDALNVLVSDHTFSSEPGQSGRAGNGGFFSIVDITHVHDDTLSHELAHHILGDTSYGLNHAVVHFATKIDSTLGMLVGIPLNVAADENNDATRESAQSVFAAGGSSDMEVSAQLDLNRGAKTLSGIITTQPAANRPKQ